MKNKKRLALEIGLVAVIVYLWLNRCKKTKAVEEAKAGADVAPTTTPTQNTDCASSASSDCMGTDTSKQSQLGKTVTVEETANFAGTTNKGIKGQYFR